MAHRGVFVRKNTDTRSGFFIPKLFLSPPYSLLAMILCNRCCTFFFSAGDFLYALWIFLCVCDDIQIRLDMFSANSGLSSIGMM